MRKLRTFTSRYVRVIALMCFIFGVLMVLAGNKVLDYTSTDEYCMSCHIHPHADQSWKQSSHFNTKSGVRVHCVDCHLPPKTSSNYLWVKGKTGMKDLWSYYTKDSASFDWEKRRRLEYATGIVFNESCEQCHQNLYPQGLSSEGAVAHLYYEENKEKLNLQCINCHLDVGHFDPNYKHSPTAQLGASGNSSQPKAIYDSATKVSGLTNFTEHVPGTSVSFNMIAIPGGCFNMGSPATEAYRNDDEGPVRDVEVSPLFIGEVEVSWDEYLAFFSSTKSEGRIDPRIVMERNLHPVDGVSGPTPPYGQPDQGWGYGENPAITMSHYAARTYCQWLSLKTGKKYRLPTEAEWEYVARGGTSTPYFFEGNPKKFSDHNWWNNIVGADTATINSYVVYAKNSNGRTMTAEHVRPNPFGVKNTLGNVMEYCADWYAPDAYAQAHASLSNPKGPDQGEEHVVRGGHYASDAKDVRAAARDYTRSLDWLKTDPQSPKSIWWLSDCTKIGFRIVCEADGLGR